MRDHVVLMNRLNKTESAIFISLFWFGCSRGIDFSPEFLKLNKQENEQKKEIKKQQQFWKQTNNPINLIARLIIFWHVPTLVKLDVIYTSGTC